MSENLGPAGLPYGCRYGAPRTPDPFTADDNHVPSAPRPRFRLKRRHVSQHLVAPTQQFLASVAAADVPIPSIEEPEIATFDSDRVHPFGGMSHLGDDQDMSSLNVEFIRGRTFSPPKTPAPGSVPSLSPSRYPNWSIDSALSDCESSPEPESRPSTSRSTRTSTSSFSQLSSCLSDDAHWSPEIEASDSFICLTSEDGQSNRLVTPGDPSRVSRKAPWTKAMETHLWATYNLYLSDPHVTPFRISKSGIPPEGVCKRVARETIRSWKGSRALAKAANTTDRKSGSSTPTADSSSAFMQWPHTAAATRARLRALCKQKARGPDGGKFRYFSRSPTPFTNTNNRWLRRLSPTARSGAAFQTQDMAMSLVLSTSEAMNPDGALAQLTSSTADPAAPEGLSKGDRIPSPDVDAEPSFAERRRLGSPFSAKSYGPSSSTSLAAVLGLSTAQRQARTVGPRRTLQSPVRLSRSATQKRKTKQSHEARKRPSLGADLWLDPRSENDTDICHESMFGSTSNSRRNDLFVPGSQAALSLPSVFSSAQDTIQLSVPVAPPPRLGSPFSATSSSFSVPNRSTRPGNLDTSMFGRPFSTIQQLRGSHVTESASFNLAARLAYIDRRLKELNGRDGGWRSESPL